MLSALKNNIKDNIDDKFELFSFNEINKIPMFLKEKYNFYEIRILDISCILLEVKNDLPSIDMIEKNLKILNNLKKGNFIFYFNKISSYRKKTLIERRISFISEDGQMFLPFLGLLLKNTPNLVKKEIQKFSPSAQLAFLFFIYNKNITINNESFAKKMNFTLITASRALNELYDAKLIDFNSGGKTGRSKEYKRIADNDYFEKGKNYLINPIKKIVYVQKVPDNSFIAGLESLSELSMLNYFENKVRAIYYKNYNKLNIKVVNNNDIIKDKNLVKLEIWKYDPSLFVKNNHVDLISLYASLLDDKDERVESELENILKGEKW